MGIESPVSASQMPSSELSNIVTFATELADIGRSNCMKYFRQPLEIDSKADLSPVTIADRSVELLMRQQIEDNYPAHGIFGEEHGQENIDRPELWVLDPIDGTKSFITGMPTFGSLISFLKNGKPIVGILEMPALNERWVGVSGQQTTFNQINCDTSDCQELTKARFYTTSLDAFDGEEAKIVEAVSRKAAIRRYGGDCYSYGLLASSHIDIVLESSLEPYDYLSLVPVIEGAGGVISDWSGNALGLKSSGQVLACSTAELHQQVLEIINS